MASAFNPQGFVNYVKENADVFISTLITGARTLEIIQREGNVQQGIKTSEKIMVLDTNATWQEGDGCGFTPLGSTDLSQRAITVGNIKINMEWCMDDLLPYVTQQLLRPGAMAEHESMPQPLEARLLDRLTAKQNRDMDRAVWQGDTTSNNDKLLHFDGFIKLIDQSGGALYSNGTAGVGTITTATNSATVTGTGTAFSSAVAVNDKLYAGGRYIGTVSAVGSNTSITLAANAAIAVTGAAFTVVPVANQGLATTGNAIARLDSLYGLVPEQLLNVDGTRLWIGADEARTWLRALTAANQFHYTAEANMLRDGFVLPGTGLKVEPTPGLSGTGRRFVIHPENMWFGTDLQNEWERFKTWYDEEDEMIRLKARWRAGVQIGFPGEVTGTLS